MEFKRAMAKMAQEVLGQNPEEEIDFNHIPRFVKEGKMNFENNEVMPIPFQLRYFNRTEVAQMFGVSIRTVNMWAKKGWILPHRPNHNVCFYKGYELLRLNRMINIVAQ